MFNKTQKNKAFTLIEVLVVTAVISLVASIVNAQMGEARQKADDAHMKTEVQQVRTAVEQYRQKTGHVPLAPSGSSYTAGNMVAEDEPEYKEVMQQLVTEGFMPEVPTSPSGQSYSYLATEDGSQAVFAATLNNEDSGSGGGSGNNSCEVINNNEIDWDSCYREGSYLENCSSITYDENLTLCVHSQYMSDKCEYDYELCSWVSSDKDLASDYLCQQFNYYDHCYKQGAPGASGPFLCPYKDTVCSGSSNSDYCSCI